MKKILIGITIALVVIVAVVLTRPQQQQVATTKIKIGVLKHESSLPIYLAEKLGYFKKYKLDVEIIELPPGDHLPALISNRVDIISPTSFPMLLGAIENNPGLLYAIIPGAEINGGETVYGIVTKKDFKGNDITSLKSKIIFAINPYTKVNLLNILKKLNFKDNEIKEIKVSNRDAALSAVLRGDADACILDQPSLAIAINTGKFSLLESNPRAKYLGTPYWSGSGAVKREVWNKKKDQFNKLLEALDEAIAYSKNNKKESQLILAKTLGIDPAVATHMGGYYFPLSKEKVDLNGIQNTVNALINADLMKKSIDLSTLFPPTYYK
ncbi:MAG: ABC transporter substrate-binding protein [Bacteroidetes bacterium]|nr:ABC transporter substrate-binding protein [Bacteroidota bacterium]